MGGQPVERQLLAGRYEWRERLGHGGFGVVWRAHDTLLQRDVAVKVIEFPPVLDDEEKAGLRRKVLREAQAAARLNHPGLVTVFDVIEDEGRPLIVMELVAAPTLKDLVVQDGPLPEPRAAAIALEVLDALTVAHEHGIIHRDVKPANVMVGQTHVQLGDFGIAAITDDPKVTSSGSLAGSPAYMAPEQARNLPSSPATDLWGLGATLWYAVEGEPPFLEQGAIATLTAVVHEEPRSLRRAKALAPLLRELLMKEPSERPSTDEVRRRLAAVAAGNSAEGDDTATIELDPRWAGTGEASTVEPTAGTPAAAAAAAAAEPRPTPATPPPPPVQPRPVVVPPAPPEDTGAEAAPSTAAMAATAPSAATGARGGAGGEPSVAEAPPVAPPPHRQAAAPSRPSSAAGLVAALAAVVVVGLVVVAVLAARGGDDSPSAAPDASTPPTSAPVSGNGAAVPDNWVPYRDRATGFRISHPPDWTVQVNGTLTDFRDPETRAYLRVDHREPPGPSPEGAWYDFEPTFAARNANYRRLQITPTTYKGYRAAIWEFTYSAGGANLRAVDLGFVTPRYGFALNFQAPVDDWDRLQPVFEAFKASFEAPSS